MYKNESIENLLDNLESELSEVIELDNPQVVEIEKEKVSLDLPVPTKRQSSEPILLQNVPVPAARRAQSLDKKEKNDENEIIQLSSMSSSSASENLKNISQNTIVFANERKPKSVKENVFIVQEAEVHQVEETKFHVSKRGKWAEEDQKKSSKEEELEPQVAAIEIKSRHHSSKIKKAKQKPQLEVISEKAPAIRDLPSTTTTTDSSQASFESSSESSSSTEESLKPAKKSKRKKNKGKNKSKKKQSSEDQTSSVENSLENEQKVDSEHAIGIFLHYTGALKYSLNLKSLRIKISLHNEDSGKLIGEVKWSQIGTFNNDFHNLICTWNEMFVFNQDLQRLKEIHNNAIMFFEITNTFGVIITWAFLKLFTPQFSNVDDKFQLQLFEYQKLNRNVFTKLRRQRNQVEQNIFDQWRSFERIKIKSTLMVTVKILNKKQEPEPAAEMPVNDVSSSVDGISRKWLKLPGQACKIPNKILNKISYCEKGSMNVKFSQDGNLVVFTEATKDGSILHIQKFPELKEMFTMFEHSDLIHDIDWLKQKQNLDGPQFMVTASSDFTSIVWCFDSSSYTYHILPHPSFVYASKFLQIENSATVQVVTAGRDCVVRVWQSQKRLEGFDLVQELEHPNSTKTSYITAIATRNSETFYTSNSHGDVIEWMLQIDKGYQLNRHFKLDDISGKIITSLELHPRGNKIFLRVQDFNGSDLNGTIFMLGVPTGLITQKHHQPLVQNEPQGRLKVSPCGTHLFASNGSLVRFNSLQNGNLTSNVKDFIKLRIPSDVKISAIDYHPKDFFLACSLYGRNGGVVICTYEANPEEKDLFEKLKVESFHEFPIALKPSKLTGTHFSDIIRKLDEVFLAPIENDGSKHQEIVARQDENTFTIDSKRSRTYTVSQGPATYTIQRSQNNTYEIQRKDESDDDTTITESFN